MEDFINNAARSIPFDNLIGGPLTACVNAQAQAANTTIEFIKGVCTNHNDTGKNKSADNKIHETASLKFSFMQNNKERVLTVPLLTIVPIPYFQIDSVKLNFRADMSFDKDNNLMAKFASQNRGEVESNQSSKYNVQNQLDVEVIASSQSIPPGLNKLLGILNDNCVVVEDENTDEINSAEKKQK